MPSSNAHGIMPERALSVSRQISERKLRKPLGLPSVNGELANRAVATGCSATDTLSFLTMSASDEKSRLVCTVQVRYIISRPYLPTVGKYGLDMMYRTCTVQTNLDFSDRKSTRMN